MQVGQRVEVQTRFDGSWSPGFEIAEVIGDSYRVRRTSDGELLPNTTGADDLRPEPGAVLPG
jgi:hypothetical protein